MNKYLIIAVCALVIVAAVEWRQYRQMKQKWETAEANVKAYGNMLDDSNKQAVALQLTVSQLGYFKDSVLHELEKTRKELKIKDKNLKALQAIQTTFSKKDTVIFRDTLFKEPSLAIDTLIKDDWYSVNLGLRYPSTIAVSPSFVSKKHIVVSSKRETVNPPKKFFLFRWFQKRHTVLNVDVIEKNPYIEEQTSRYVEILK